MLCAIANLENRRSLLGTAAAPLTGTRSPFFGLFSPFLAVKWADLVSVLRFDAGLSDNPGWGIAAAM